MYEASDRCVVAAVTIPQSLAQIRPSNAAFWEKEDHKKQQWMKEKDVDDACQNTAEQNLALDLAGHLARKVLVYDRVGRRRMDQDTLAPLGPVAWSCASAIRIWVLARSPSARSAW